MNNSDNHEEDMSMSNDEEISRKRKTTENDANNNNFPIPRSRISENDEDNDDVLTLSLSFRPSTRHRPIPHPSPPSTTVQSLLSEQPLTNRGLQLNSTRPLYTNPFSPPPSNFTAPPPPPHSISPHSRVGPIRPRRNPTQSPRDGKSDTIPQPYPWATNRRATVHSLTYLESKHVTRITGQVQCKRCEKDCEMDFDLREKFFEVGSFIAKNKGVMHDRAPSVWMNPVLPTCKFCDQENSAKPVISEKKKAINWLFLLLGQMLGCCTLEQLKYFCKHTKNHRTGAKDRVLYLTYLALCKQLDPRGPFDR